MLSIKDYECSNENPKPYKTFSLLHKIASTSHFSVELLKRNEKFKHKINKYLTFWTHITQILSPKSVHPFKDIHFSNIMHLTHAIRAECATDSLIPYLQYRHVAEQVINDLACFYIPSLFPIHLRMPLFSREDYLYRRCSYIGYANIATDQYITLSAATRIISRISFDASLHIENRSMICCQVKLGILQNNSRLFLESREYVLLSSVLYHQICIHSFSISFIFWWICFFVNANLAKRKFALK